MPGSAEIIREIDAGQKPIPPGYEIEEEEFFNPDGKTFTTVRYLVKKTADMSGEHVTSAHAFFTTQWGVSLTLDSIGADQFAQLTKQAYDNQTQLAILLDGVVVSAPGVHEGAIYGGNAQITGNFDETPARRSRAPRP